LVPSPPRSPTCQVDLSALQDAGIPHSAHDPPRTLLLALPPLIIAAATADPWEFDRKRYDELMGIWEALDAEQISPQPR
jgi:hypothetical protein